MQLAVRTGNKFHAMIREVCLFFLISLCVPRRRVARELLFQLAELVPGRGARLNRRPPSCQRSTGLPRRWSDKLEMLMRSSSATPFLAL